MDLVWLDEGQIVVVGEGGTILRSNDRGQTWRAYFGSTGAWLWAVHFPDSQTGTAVGDGGVILGTTSGGKTWQPQSSNTDASLWGVHFTSAETGIVSGAGGALLCTTDGGQNWQRLVTRTGSWLEGISFPTARAGYVVGENGVVLRTADGGATWGHEHSGTSNWLWGISSGPDVVTVVGERGTIIRRAMPGPSSVASAPGPHIPAGYGLRQNHPNPFRPASNGPGTLIRFSLPYRSVVRLEVRDLLGRLVRRLVDDALPAGEQVAAWDGRNDRGGVVPPGVYFCRFVAPGPTQTRKMMLLM